MMEVVRFFSVSMFGLLLDVTVALLLATLIGLPLWIAAATGFVLAGGANYILHEIWTFQRGSQALSRPRALKYLGASLVTLLARISVVALLDHIFQSQHALLILLCGAGASLLVNFALGKRFVFTAPAPRAQRSK